MRQSGWEYDLIYENVDPYTIQEPDLTPEQIITLLKNLVAEGEARVIGNALRKIVFILTRQNKFTANLHIFSDADNPLDLYIATKQLASWVWANTNYLRIEGRSHLKGIKALAKKCNWKFDGVREKSYFKEDGTLLDEYEFSINKHSE